jgi:hypothetical protein
MIMLIYPELIYALIEFKFKAGAQILDLCACVCVCVCVHSVCVFLCLIYKCFSYVPLLGLDASFGIQS